MKKKKAASYLLVIASLIAISITTPLLISSVSGYIAGKIRGEDTEAESETVTESDQSEAVSEYAPEYAQLSLEEESEDKSPADRSDTSPAERPDAGKTSSQDKTQASDGIIVVDEDFYDEPVYDTPEEEDAANRKAYEDMNRRLLSASEAADAYRKDFNPVYDELAGGLMNAFINGREQIFYEDIANYCFGRYNTTCHIGMVRFDALIENTEEKETVILEFFTDEAMLDQTRVPDLVYCSYNKKTEAFVFFTGAGK